MPQTIDNVNAVWNAGSSAVVGTLTPQSYDRRVVAMAVSGPTDSTLTIYRGYTINTAFMMSRVYPAASRTYDSTMGDAPLILRAGEAATFAWTGGSSAASSTAAATVTSQWGSDAMV